MFFAAIAAVLFGAYAPSTDNLASFAYAPAFAAEQSDGMARVHLTLKKLQDAMTSMKDFDELEAAGMPKKNVDRMRRAMQLKINQMMEDVIKSIHSL